MKPFAWVNHAVQALATEGYGHSGSNGRESDRVYGGRPDTQQSLYIGLDGKYRYTTEFDSYTPISPSPRSKSRPIIVNLTPEYNNFARADIWSDTFEPESPPPTPSPVFNASFHHDLKNARTEFDVTVSEKGSTYADSEYTPTDGSEDHVQMPSLPKGKREISATIFQSSTSIPISIVVTSPDEDDPESANARPVLQRNSASFPLLSADRDPYDNIDRSLLVPPNGNQLDSRKLRKAQEFCEIRKWLIIFLNSKGDKFPRKLRLRMMDVYCIREFDLAPEIVAKFNTEVQDEGVALEEGEPDEAASLSILGAAFRSKIEEALPKRERVAALPVPPPSSWQRQGNSPKKAEIKKPEPVKIAGKSLPPTPEEDEEFDMDLVPAWLGPLISTSTSSKDSLLSDQQYLKRAYSAPNLKLSRPHLNSTPSTRSVPGIRPRGNTLNGDEDKGRKRGSFISGAFGAMRDAMSGKSKREDKLLKKKYGVGR